MGFVRRIFGGGFSLRLPEMRAFWFFLPFLIVVLGVDVVFLPAPWPFLNGGLLLLLGVIVFLTSAWAAKLNLEAQLERNKLKAVVLGLEDAIVVYDQSITVAFFNSAAETLFGLRAEEVMGQELKPQDVENSKRRLLAQVMFPSLAPVVAARSKAGEYPQISDLSFTDPVLELRVTTTPIADDRGRLLGFMKIIRSRTREMTLLRSKSEFITVASHQLRTPITEINWLLQSLSQDEGLESNSKELVQNALTSSRRLVVLVEDLLNTTRIEEGRFGYSFEPADVVAFLDRLLAEAMPQVERAGLKIYFDRPKDKLPQVMIDPAKLSLVISNLIDNAVRYNVPNGEVVVAVKKLENQPFLDVSIKDSGIGIPPEEVSKIFTKFFRSSNALKFQTEGSGLGLYIARNIIRAHGGDMGAESELNRGSTFHFTLPTDPALVPQKETAVE